MATDGMCSGEAKPEFKGISLTLNPKTEAECERLFDALADGGQVHQPLIKTFFSPKFGVVADKFGVNWMVLVEQEQSQGGLSDRRTNGVFVMNATSAATATKSPDFVISRVLDAPRELVWKCFTEAEHQEWWGPKGVTVTQSKIDLRPGGMHHYAMKAPTAP